MTTQEVVDRLNAGLLRRAFKKYAAFPVGITLLHTLAVVLDAIGYRGRQTDMDTLWAIMSVGLLWVFYYTWVTLVAERSKYRAAACVADQILEQADGRWVWCEESGTYAAHYGTGGPDAEEADEDADEAGDTEK